MNIRIRMSCSETRSNDNVTTEYLGFSDKEWGELSSDKVAVAEGDRKIATARADSAALVIAAAGEAEAIRRKQVSLSETYIDYLKVGKWNGILPTVQSGSGGLMLQLPSK